MIRVRLIIEEDPMGSPMWNDFELNVPREGETIILSFGHFFVRRVYHHPDPLTIDYESVIISAQLELVSHKPTPAKWMRLCEGGLESAGWKEVPEDKRFWRH